MTSVTPVRKSKRGVLCGAILASSAVAIAGGDAWGTSIEWTNTTSTVPTTTTQKAAQNWTNTANWSPAAEPGSGTNGSGGATDTIFIRQGGLAYINSVVPTIAGVSLGSGSPGGSLYIDNGGSLTSTGSVRAPSNAPNLSSITVISGGTLNAASILLTTTNVNGATFDTAGTISTTGGSATSVSIGASSTYNMTGGSLSLGGGSAVGASINNGGKFNLSNGTISAAGATSTINVGSGSQFTQSNGTVSLSGSTANVSIAGAYNMSGGSISLTGGAGSYVSISSGGQFTQSNGSTSAGILQLAGGSYTISGGSVAASNTGSGLTFGLNASSSAGTLNVVGSAASSINFATLKYNDSTVRTGAVWGFTLDNSTNHITPVTLAGYGGNAGNNVRGGATLQVGLNGGVLLSNTKTFSLINGPSAIGSTDFGTLPGPLWNESLGNSSKSVQVSLSSTAGVDKGTLDANGTKAATFTKSSYGYVDLANIGTPSSLDLYLDAQGGTLSNFTNALTTAGITNTSGSYTFGSQSYNVKLTLNPSTSGNSEFAWDLSNIDSNMGLDAVSLFQSHSAVALLTNTSPSASYSAMVGTANPGGTAGSSTITVSGHNGSYTPGYLNNITTNGNKGYVTIAGFTPGDAVIGALSLTVGGSAPTSAQLTQLINDLNAGATGLTAVSFASLQSSNLDAYNALKNNDPNYGTDPLEIAFLNSGAYSSANPTYLALDFSNENSSLGNVLVTDIAAIPEPAAAALVGLVAAVTLLRRRRRTSGTSE